MTRVIGLLLFAGCQAASVSIPEPMVFDMVRGLDAKKGELEVNTLAVLPLSSGDPAAPLVAPEIEYAVDDGLTVEFELPFEDGGLAAIKLAGQWTFGGKQEDGFTGFAHGTQVIVERLVEFSGWELAALYLPAWRFDRTWSTQTMFGIGALVGGDVRDDLGAIANATLFADLNDRWIAGLEIDGSWFDHGGASVLIMPQVHYLATKRFTIQFGIGVLYLDGTVAAGIELPVVDARGWFPQLSLRAVYEF